MKPEDKNIGETTIGMNRRLHIWVVDDDIQCCELMMKMLNRASDVKCERVFYSATDLLVTLKNDPHPDVILMDVQMPGMTGIEAIPLVRQLAPLVLVVMMSAFFDSDDKAKVLAQGAIKYIRKNSLLEPRGILEAIAAVWQQRSIPAVIQFGMEPMAAPPVPPV